MCSMCRALKFKHLSTKKPRYIYRYIILFTFSIITLFILNSLSFEILKNRQYFVLLLSTLLSIYNIVHSSFPGKAISES